MLPRCMYKQNSQEICRKLICVCVFSQLGAQFDGYCSTVATTVVVGSGAVTGTKADVIKAAETALEATLRLLRPGHKVKRKTQQIMSVH